MLGLLGGPTSYSNMDHNVHGLFAVSKHMNDWVHEPSSETISMASDAIVSIHMWIKHVNYKWRSLFGERFVSCICALRAKVIKDAFRKRV